MTTTAVVHPLLARIGIHRLIQRELDPVVAGLELDRRVRLVEGPIRLVPFDPCAHREQVV